MERASVRGSSRSKTSQSYRMMRRMGPLKSIAGLIPGLGKQLQGATSTSASSAGWRRSSCR